MSNYNPEFDYIYKKVLDNNEITEAIEPFNNFSKKINEYSSLSTGVRTKKECQTSKFICDRLQTVLRDYLGNLSFSPEMRLYNQSCGGIKPHKDAALFGKHQYTCLIYLTDNFEGGYLSLKIKRSDTELQQCDFNLKHKVVTLTPKTGYCVVFDKNILHYANEVVDGCKEILVIDIESLN